HTLLWRPAFFSDAANKDLARLVLIDHVLKSDQRFEEATRHLSVQDKASAKQLLKNQQSQLQERLKAHVAAAYGLRRDEQVRGSIVAGTDPIDSFTSLDPGFEPQVPATSDLAEALTLFLSQALRYQYPSHPTF